MSHSSDKRCMQVSRVAYLLLLAVLALCWLGLGHNMNRQRRSPYHRDLRELVVYKYVNVGLSMQQIADDLGGVPSLRTVQRIIEHWRNTGSTALLGRKGVRHEVRKIDAFAKRMLVSVVTEDPSALLYEMAAEMSFRMGSSWTVAAVSRGLHELGFVRLKTTQHAREADPEAQAAYKDVIRNMSVGPGHLLFIDEVAADSKVVNRLYAWAMKGFKTCTNVLFLRDARFSTVTAMSADGLVGEPLIIEGAVDKEMFTEWFCVRILPHLGHFPTEKHCVVVMDNCAIHCKEDIKTMCASVGALAIFLPPYSPELNPIEQVFGKVKQFFKSSRNYYGLVGNSRGIASADKSFAIRIWCEQ